ncbi:MAG: methylenetetrahydrofolate--tRNA-(uracil(54)-C(5))-methyltransferase (FADH(2)-oxidizing) TrmFO [Deltaproteobacteria bacterium]|nr:methylenetetrahydrofolate--tRNA-(uracil(54)-C(5))-methyltransferase (FADH(2)-oxidizing) TrmFO [Deltaproteobacteria bacterium]
MTRVHVIGGGLAGCEAAWQLARRGVAVRLYEMRPARGTEAHRSDRLAELVCSNSFRSASPDAAVGLLKEEMRRLGSLILQAAESARVPAGTALAVDRDGFSAEVTRSIEAEPSIEVVREEVTSLERFADELVIVASGPLTSPALYDELRRLFGRDHLYFYDAISPIVTADSIDRAVAFRASRYGKGGDDYLNCPLSRDEYRRFVDELLRAEKVPTREFERCLYFEGCMPIEEMARRGRETLAFGPMRPVGLVDPHTGERPYAVVQLRQDDRAGTLYSLVGFQTKMTYPEQRRVLPLIPGLAAAEFVRLGSLHRNTFIHSPSLLEPTLELRRQPTMFFAGQLVGVEGYVESAASGLLAGVNAARRLRGRAAVAPPPTTALGSLLAYVSDRARGDFQPMNASYGLFAPIAGRLRGKDKRAALGARAAGELSAWIVGEGVLAPSADPRRQAQS